MCAFDCNPCCLQGLVLPSSVAADVELASLLLRACPFTDADELMPICYRCQATNTLLNKQVHLQECQQTQ
jgi:intraflagellar transport protein 122